MKYSSPVYSIIAVPVEKIKPNTYNPNAVAPPELRLLYESIKQDGYTMPIVCYYAKTQDVYVIVDGFHRYRVMLEHKDIYVRENGMLPVSVIDKPLDHRMASTIRHNRARGSHDVELMSNIVKELHELGRSDDWISRHLGMDKNEILRLKQITGLTALFKDIKFGQAWQPEEPGEFEKAESAAFADAEDIKGEDMEEEAADEPENTPTGEAEALSEESEKAEEPDRFAGSNACS